MAAGDKQLYQRSNPLIRLEEKPSSSVLGPLFIVSFACLYLELMLIRWIGTEIRVFAYFQNLTLIACFLGFGVGCYRSAERKPPFMFEAGTLALLILLVGLPFRSWKSLMEVLSAALSFSTDSQNWSAIFLSGASPIRLTIISVILVASLLLLIVATMVPAGQWVGTYLNAAPNPITAYSVNLLGSLLGMWFFAGMSYLRLAPFFWFAIAFILFITVRPVTARFDWMRSLLVALSLLVLGYSGLWAGQTHWSPYQKLELHPMPFRQFNLLVNNTGYMTLANVSSDHLQSDPLLARNLENSSYDAPFRFVGSRDQVLIVGAGAGNDVDAALRNGAKRIDAIEIDPVVYALGKRFHPDHPYDSPEVHVIVDDARSYLRSSHKTYDVIVFGLLDSHTEFSGYSNMRIDNFVYTQESLRDAKRLLKNSGVLIVKFEVRPPWTWMGERFYAMFDGLFGRPPIVFYAPPLGGMLSATEFIASNDSIVSDRAKESETAEFLQLNPPEFPLSLSNAPEITTDDWPYVYNRNRRIPRTYFSISVILLAIALLSLSRSFGGNRISTWTFFFLGAGFLLIETQMITRLALYFGSTWIVNCVALSMLLLVLMAANACVEIGIGKPLGIWYLAVIGSLLAVYLVKWENFPLSSRTIGLLLVVAYCAPVFAAGIIFTETLRHSPDKSGALGSNIVGAVAGGLMENPSFIFGLKALLLVAMGFYLASAIAAWMSARIRVTVVNAEFVRDVE